MVSRSTPCMLVWISPHNFTPILPDFSMLIAELSLYLSHSLSATVSTGCILLRKIHACATGYLPTRLRYWGLGLPLTEPTIEFFYQSLVYFLTLGMARTYALLWKVSPRQTEHQDKQPSPEHWNSYKWDMAVLLKESLLDFWTDNRKLKPTHF